MQGQTAGAHARTADHHGRARGAEDERGVARPQEEALLTLEHVAARIGHAHVIHDVSLAIPARGVVALLGRNGAGKTSTLRAVINLVTPVQGVVAFAGEDITGLLTHEIAQRGIGYSPDYRGVFADLSVLENLQLAERRRGDLERKQELIFEMFPDLARLRDHPGSKLSGGQQQMLAIARTLVPDNRLLLIDEPSQGLSPLMRTQTVDALRAVAHEMAILLVEQNLEMAASLAETYVILTEGRSVESGDMAVLMGDRDTIVKHLGAG
jgi:branched-chain amino acid transport system ATP-binding protein